MVLALATWVRWVVAVAIFVGISSIGLMFLRGIARMQPHERVEPEDVEDLDVYFVCVECGTEFQVTRLGEAQVPRHCGEVMNVVRRPRQQPLSN